MKQPLLTYASKFGAIKLRYRKRSGTLTYEQKGGNQSTSDGNGVSLDAHIHALYGLVLQTSARNVLMIGCGGGTLATMLARTGRKVTAVDIDKVSFKVARRHFGLPADVTCRVGDGLSFMQASRRRYDAVIVDAFVGENIPAHMKDAPFFAAVGRCVSKDGLALVNVCLDRRGDPTADNIAAGFARNGWRVRLLDSPGSERNAIVLAGNVKGLKRPAMLLTPRAAAKQTRRELKAMGFRRRRAAKS